MPTPDFTPFHPGYEEKEERKRKGEHQGRQKACENDFKVFCAWLSG
jgi:hypothetical protein